MENGHGDDTLYGLLGAAYRSAEAFAQDALFELGLTSADARVLAAIPEDDITFATELATRARLPVSTATRALRRLEQVGYVVLRRSAFDGRRLHPALTTIGRSARRAVLGFEDNMDREMTANMSAWVKSALYSALLHVALLKPRSAQPPE